MDDAGNTSSSKTFDPAVMDELLELPEVKREVEGMGAQLLEWYKSLLVECGVYTDFVKRRNVPTGEG